jgi:hypothetical protein
MSAWTSGKPGEYRFDFDRSNGITLVHNREMSRAHMFIGPTFWRTDNGDVPADTRAAVLAVPPECMQREALVQARNALRAALDKVEAGLADEHS